MPGHSAGACGIPNNAIAQQFGLSRPTVNAIRAAFLRGGVEALQQDPKRKRSRPCPEQGLEQRILDTTLKTGVVPKTPKTKTRS